MKKTTPRIISALIIALFLNGCVSVKLSDRKIEKSKDIKLNDPPIPFAKIKNDHFDYTWRSQKTGNTITLLSECNTETDPTLQQLTLETAQSLTDFTQVSNTETTYNQRAALDTVVLGHIDGIKVKMKMRVFKKNGCHFTFNYFGSDTKFSGEEVIFDNFLNSIEVKHASSYE